MPIPTPVHSRTQAICHSYEWRNWSGYLAAALYEPSHENEYYAVRNAAALFDVSPLFKYEIFGPDALAVVNRIMTRDIATCAVGQVMYSPWCDEAGKIIDDGTISRLAETRFRLTAADPNLRWFQDCGYGLDVTVKDVSTDLAALSLQGPLARAILKKVVQNVDLDKLKFFRLVEATFAGVPLTITRTGYTGDLGYELWLAPDAVEQLWDMLLDKGSAYGLTPAGLVALDMVRIEAGLLLIEVDYISSQHAVIEAQKSSPYEAGLGWTVALSKKDFVGHQALRAEQRAGSPWAFVGLELDWLALERLFAAVDLPPKVTGRASRVALPVYKAGKHIGQVTSHTFSPLLKKYIALATLNSRLANLGTKVDVEITVEYRRYTVPATVVKLPFFNPERKRT